MPEKKDVEEKNEEEVPEIDPSLVPFEIVDNDDGSYFINFTSDEESTLFVEIHYRDENNDLQPIRGNPFKCTFVKSKP